MLLWPRDQSPNVGRLMWDRDQRAEDKGIFENLGILISVVEISNLLIKKCIIALKPSLKRSRYDVMVLPPENSCKRMMLPKAWQ